MASEDANTASEPMEEPPLIRSIRAGELRDVLAKGLDDFWAMPPMSSL
jgi:hypothetical protein